MTTMPNGTIQPSVYLTLAVVNSGAIVLFALLLFVAPMFSSLSTRVNFTQLDRAGVINVPALQQFHESYGFGDVRLLEHRSTVPAFIAASPINAEKHNAFFGLMFTFANAVAWWVLWWKARQRKQKRTLNDPAVSTPGAAY
jgi:hypothetical protein